MMLIALHLTGVIQKVKIEKVDWGASLRAALLHFFK